jgi:hypothetical protein
VLEKFDKELRYAATYQNENEGICRINCGIQIIDVAGLSLWKPLNRAVIFTPSYTKIKMQ